MDCRTTREWLDAPEEARDPLPAEEALAHLRACPECAALEERRARALTTFKQSQEGDLSAAGQQRLLAALQAERRAGASARSIWSRPSGRAASPPAGARAQSLWRPAAPWLAAASVAVALMIFGRTPSEQPEDPVRTKGTELPRATRTLDLRLDLEAPGGAQPSRLDDGGKIGPGAGILFSFEVGGEGTLVLIERGPGHHLHVLYSAVLAAGAPAELRVVTVSDGAGRPQRYHPDGPPGDYTYVAVLADGAPELDAAFLDKVWRQYADEVVRAREGQAAPATPGSSLLLDAHHVKLDVGGVPAGAPQ